jgi:WD40 repeat protein
LLVAAGDRGLATWKVRLDRKSVDLIEPREIALTGLYDLVVRPQGDAAIVLDKTGKMHLVDLGKGVEASPLPFRARPDARSLQTDARGHHFTFVTSHGQLATCLWSETATGRCRATGQPASVMAVTASGRWVATAEHGKGLTIYDLLADRKWLQLPPDDSDIWGLAWSTDGARLAVGLSDGGVAIWELEEVRASLAKLGIQVESTVAAVSAALRE